MQQNEGVTATGQDPDAHDGAEPPTTLARVSTGLMLSAVIAFPSLAGGLIVAALVGSERLELAGASVAAVTALPVFAVVTGGRRARPDRHRRLASG